MVGIGALARLAFRCAMIGALACVVATTIEAQNTSEILDRARLAVGRNSDSASGVLRVAGAFTFLNVEEQFVSDYAADGRFRVSFAGQLNRDVRFDGKSVRGSEFSKLWHELEFFEREFELLQAWVYSGYWTDQLAPLSFSEVESEPGADGRVVLGVQLRDGLLRARLELNSDDYRVQALIVPSAGEELTTTYSRYEAIDGFWMAREVHSNLGMGSFYTCSVRAAKLVAGEDTSFDPKPDVIDFRFDSSVSPEVEVTRSESKHLWVRSKVNGQDLGLFLFDTGARFSGLSREAAESLVLSSFGDTGLTGVGGNLTSTKMFRAAKLQLGPLVIDDLVFSEISVERKSRMVGEKVAGVLGWDVMRRAIVDLETEGQLRLFDPATYEL
ncbi:MAG: hypothetical protein ACI87A_001034 [Planctomycetota bacterium]|jgi:hypothetical protein